MFFSHAQNCTITFPTNEPLIFAITAQLPAFLLVSGCMGTEDVWSPGFNQNMHALATYSTT